MSWNVSEFHKWRNGVVIDVDFNDSRMKDAQDIINAPASSMRAQNLDEIHDTVTRLAQYGIFLTNQLNSAKASAKYYEKEFKEYLSKVLIALKINGKSREERELNAIQQDEKLNSLYECMKEYKLKAERLEGLPYIIGTYYSIANEIFKLRLSERKYGTKGTK